MPAGMPAVSPVSDSVNNISQTVLKVSTKIKEGHLQKFSRKSRERLSGTKSYAIATGFISDRGNTLIGENAGWRLENVVLIESLRRYSSETEDIYCYKPPKRQKEVDFAVCRQRVVLGLIQVANSVNDKKTFKREISSLSDAGTKLNRKIMSLICPDETQDIGAGAINTSATRRLHRKAISGKRGRVPTKRAGAADSRTPWLRP